VSVICTAALLALWAHAGMRRSNLVQRPRLLQLQAGTTQRQQPCHPVQSLTPALPLKRHHIAPPQQIMNRTITPR
jgi:hypothetical protein